MTTPYRLALGAIVSVLSGCFSYVPAELDTVPNGQDVRVYLTREGMREIEGDFEITEVTLSGPTIRGTLVRLPEDEDHVSIRIPVLTREVGFYHDPLGQNLLIPKLEIVQIERRQLNRSKTAALGAGTVGFVGAVLYLIVTNARNKVETPDEIPSDDILIPLYSLP